jgi:hypothetical protein
MMIAIGLLAGVLLHLTYRHSLWRINRADKLGLAVFTPAKPSAKRPFHSIT